MCTLGKASLENCEEPAATRNVHVLPKKVLATESYGRTAEDVHVIRIELNSDPS